MVSQKNNLFFWIGVIVLVVLCFLFFFLGIAPGLPLRAHHVLKFLLILLAYGVGAYCLKKYAAAWMLRTWHGVYLTVLFLLVLLGVYDWAVARTSLGVREIANNLQEFLVSPILFVGLTLLDRYYRKGL